MDIDLPAGWTTTTLGDCATWYSGGTPRTSVKEYWDGDIPWITASSLHEFYIRDSERKVTELGVQNGTRLMPENTIIFVVRGMSLKSEFRVGIARRPVTFGQDCKAIVAHNGVAPMFLANAIRARKQIVLRLVSEASHGTGRLETDPLKQLEIALPPFPIQQRIAEILGRLDDKIEVNRRINRTLEAMAQALYKHWFVDFGPFQDEAAFVESELGLIPQGWRVVTLEEAVDINPLRSLRRGQLAPYLDMANMPTSSARALNWTQREFNSGMRFRNGDVLVARITPCLENGKTAYVDFLEDGQVGWGSTEYIVLRSKPPLPMEFAYLFARTKEFRSHAIQHMTGTSGRQRVAADSLKMYQIIVPTEEVAKSFGERVKNSFKVMKQLDQESAKLTEIRDYLLPKLLSGEISVETATQQADELTERQPQQLALTM